jgi:methylmalonyl-CoA/ethylmalonyl-CoA epimerase
VTTRLQHVAIAVADLDATLARVADTWGLHATSRERVDDQRVEEAMVEVGETSLQFIAPTDASSTVARFIDRRGEGLHHIALEVEDLRATLATLRSQGVSLIDDEPRTGGGGHQVAFVHPRDNFGVLLELVQSASDTHSA